MYGHMVDFDFKPSRALIIKIGQQPQWSQAVVLINQVNASVWSFIEYDHLKKERKNLLIRN